MSLNKHGQFSICPRTRTRPLLTPDGLTTAAAAAASAGIAAAPVAASATAVVTSAAAWVADAPAPLPVLRPVLVLWRNFL
jgi:hypothetical protein